MGRSVVVLEDDDDTLETLAQLMELLGASCLRAHSLDEMVRSRESVLRCDLAILDINLGYAVPSGIDAYRWLRGQRFAGTVVFLTGHARTHPLVAEACETREARLLDKPIGVAELRQILQEPAP
jgi:DNA-binding response OmpR family regulator